VRSEADTASSLLKNLNQWNYSASVKYHSVSKDFHPFVVSSRSWKPDLSEIFCKLSLLKCKLWY